MLFPISAAELLVGYQKPKLLIFEMSDFQFMFLGKSKIRRKSDFVSKETFSGTRPQILESLFQVGCIEGVCFQFCG